ncbi:MAG: glycosyltransferase family 2 protein [Alcanivorax sp.]|nr:glycosyltransferase family 2 protein [Alcanivorax sp.]
MATDRLKLLFYQIAASGVLPARWFEPDLPPLQARAAITGRLHLEVVSHCWQYSHLLIYQLSSLVLFPPRDMDLTMTVFYCPEDAATAALLGFFADQRVPGVRWNWQPLPRQALFRRSIGRNRAALATTADWVWFTDCDLMFREGCLDALSDLLQGRQEALFYPDEERCTDLLEAENPMLGSGRQSPTVLDIGAEVFTSLYPTRATGPLQIAHGDVCRAVGYCRHIRVYQMPVESFAKCHEDRAFRWLLRTRGEPLKLPGVYRIRHVHKGRYSGSETHKRLRTRLRALKDRR